MRGRERRGGVAGPDRRPLPLHQQAFSTAGCTTARKPPVFFHSINTAGSACHSGNEARTGWSSGFCYYLANSFVRHVTDGKCKKKAPRKIHKSKRQKHKRVLLNDLLGELIKMLAIPLSLEAPPPATFSWSPPPGTATRGSDAQDESLLSFSERECLVYLSLWIYSMSFLHWAALLRKSLMMPQEQELKVVCRTMFPHGRRRAILYYYNVHFQYNQKYDTDCQLCVHAGCAFMQYFTHEIEELCRRVIQVLRRNGPNSFSEEISRGKRLINLKRMVWNGGVDSYRSCIISTI
ncbi:uncharacterized protein LOC125514954 isoform X2 [Triticum urartu]|uniref:uncharacterized protein LOC125514954 isoform X2 n=2 Tax=Triticum TaxID=4564 RepID=UPI002043AE94|nr:uncharacterized protein LOC125514954 isoform X2 [Triticum urartu]